jgi:hypothetical protein
MSVDHEGSKDVTGLEADHNILVCNGRHSSLGVIGLFRLLLNFGHQTLCFNGEGKLLLRDRVENLFPCISSTFIDGGEGVVRGLDRAPNLR